MEYRRFRIMEDLAFGITPPNFEPLDDVDVQLLHLYIKEPSKFNLYDRRLNNEIEKAKLYLPTPSGLQPVIHVIPPNSPPPPPPPPSNTNRPPRGRGRRSSRRYSYFEYI
jgi:hypothetical protein